MFYEKDFVRPRQGATKGLLVFNTRLAKYRSCLVDNFSHSTIHGMHYVFQPGQRLWQRYFWLSIVIAAAVSCFVMYSILSERHNEQHLVTIVETTKLPVYNIEFPSIAICPWNHVNWLRATTAAERFMPANSTKSDLSTFEELLVAMETQSFGTFENLDVLASRNLSSISKISLMDLATYLAFRCAELFITDSCTFDDTPYDCCKLFVQEYTEKGLCLVFNSMITEESRNKLYSNPNYPYRLNTAGEGSGLVFMLRMNRTYVRPESRIPFAMHLMIKKSHQWTETQTYRLYPNTENYVTIRPEMAEVSSNTYHMTPTKRRCYFNNENHPYFKTSDLSYNRYNCLALCQQYHLLFTCNCTLPLFFPKRPGSRECQIPDFMCLYENRDIFSYTKQKDQDNFIKDPRRGMYCYCPTNCHALIYYLKLNVKELDSKLSLNATTSLIKADIFYGKRWMTKYQTKLEYTYLDLLANFGGILGLCVGASALSFVELAYSLHQLLWLLIRDLFGRLRRIRNKHAQQIN